jgi:hypothetical protein
MPEVYDVEERYPTAPASVEAANMAVVSSVLFCGSTREEAMIHQDSVIVRCSVIPCSAIVSRPRMKLSPPPRADDLGLHYRKIGPEKS